MTKKIGLISPDRSQYNVIFYFIKSLYEAFLEEGVDAILYNDVHAALKNSKEDCIDLYVGFNGSPYIYDKTFPQVIKKPFLSLLIDPFYRFMELTDDPFISFGCDDYASVIYLNEMYLEKAIFLPHAVESSLKPDYTLEKKYDVVFMATFIDFEKRSKSWSEKYTREVTSLMFEIVEESFSSKQSFIEIALKKLSSAQFLKFKLYDALKDIELYIKGKERIDLLKSIKNIPIHVFGGSVDENNWKSYFQNQKNIFVHEPIPYVESLNIERQSKIVLNSSLKNKYGAHERVFSALALGSLVFTSQNAFLDQYFTKDVDIGFFNPNDLKTLEDNIAFYINDEPNRLFISENGRSIVMQHHTWNQRVRTIIDCVFPRISLHT